MKRKKIVPFLMLLVILILAACGQTASQSAISTLQTSLSAEDPSAAIEFTDLAGTKHLFVTAPQRLVVVEASQCEIVFALGAAENVVALGEYCDYPEEAAEFVKVGSGSQMNIEEIVALEPDCVLMGTMASSPEQVAALKSAGIPVVVLYAGNIEETYDNIATIGKILDRNKEAQQIIATMKQQLSEVRAAVSADYQPKVYYEVSPLAEGPWTCGSKTFQHELIELAGGVNIFADLEGWQLVSEEQIIERNPDVIITSMHTGQNEDPIAEILRRSGWEKITAVAAEEVYKIDANIVSRAAPRLVDGALAFEDCLQGTQP